MQGSVLFRSKGLRLVIVRMLLPSSNGKTIWKFVSKDRKFKGQVGSRQYNQLPNDAIKDLVLFISPFAVARLCTKLIYLVGEARGLPWLDVSLTSCSEGEKENERERERERNGKGTLGYNRI